MSARPGLIAALLIASTLVAAAAPKPKIPASELAGRERERFLNKFPEPRATGAPLVIVPDAAKAKRKCRGRGAPRTTC